MAQPDHYVQTDCSAPDHPKVHALAEALKCHEVAAFGAVDVLRCRVMRHCPSGDVTTVTERSLRAWLLNFPRVTWDAFVAAGFVDKAGDRRVMHGWERYARKEEMRRNNAERQQRHRDKRVTSRGSNGAEVEEEVEVEEEGEMKMMDGGLASTAPSPTLAKHPRKKRVGLPESGAVRDLADWWNALAAECALVAVESIDAKRDRLSRDRIAEGLWERRDELANAIRGSSHHRGDNADGWRAGFDWLVGRGHWIALIERSKVAPKPRETPGERQRSILDAVRAVRQEQESHDRA